MYGETLKKIRKMKGFTQKEVYTDVVSKTFYSDFESGKYSISLDKFEGLLNNLNISYAEFTYFHNQKELSQSEQLDKTIDELYKNGKFEELYTIYEENHVSPKKEIRFLASKAYLLVLITYTNFYRFSREPLHEIVANLEIAKMWTLNEIKLAKLVLLSMSEQGKAESAALFERIKEELKKCQSFDTSIYFEEVGDLFFNRIQSLLIINDISEAENTLTTYAAIIQRCDNIHLFMQLHFIKLLLGLYLDYQANLNIMKRFLTQVKNIPASDCHFFHIIFEIHNEKAKNSWKRYSDTK